VSETDTGLSRDVITLASTVEGQGGRSAFFTGVPLSFEPFGFDRGFGLFESVAPQEDRPATEPVTLAKKWLAKHLGHEDPVLAVLHLRGGHPPFDISTDATAELPPPEYGGNLTPRRSAIQLGEIRERNSARNRQMPDEDWTRLWALQKASLLRQNGEIAEFFDWLRRRDAYDDSLIILVGDVAAGEVPLIPFADHAPLDESYLSPPLIIKFPSAHEGGSEVFGSFAPRDLAQTLLEGLGLTWDVDGGSIDLGSSDAARLALLRPHVAYRDTSYSMRLGEMLLRGEDGHAPKLCQPSIDPNCLTDRSDERALESRALWFELFQELTGPLSKPPAKIPVEPIERHQNALVVWGVKP
jgi:hypothetical protein